MPLWYWILILLGVVVPICYRLIMAYVITPMRVKKSQWMSRDGGWTLGQPGELTTEVRELMQRWVPQLLGEGFAYVATAYSDNSVPGSRAVVTILKNKVAGVTAAVSAVAVSGRRALAVGLTSKMTDGTTIVTSNTKTIRLTPAAAEIEAVSFPWVGDARTLCEAHRRRLAAWPAAVDLEYMGREGVELERLEEEHRRSAEQMVRCGYRYWDEASGKYWLSWKGAYLSSWKVLPPLREWRRRAAMRRFESCWASLGMTRWRPETDGAAANQVGGGPLGGGQPAADVTANATGLGGAAGAGGVQWPGALVYETALTSGEVRFEWTPGRVLIRIGTPSVWQYLLMRWALILGIIFWGALLTFWLTLWASNFSVVRRYRVNTFQIPWRGILYVSFFLWDIWLLVSGVIKSRGPTVLIGSSAGVEFENSPDWTRTGLIAREDVLSLLILVIRPGLFAGKRYRLVVNRDGARRLILAEGPDLQRWRK